MKWTLIVVNVLALPWTWEFSKFAAKGNGPFALMALVSSHLYVSAIASLPWLWLIARRNRLRDAAELLPDVRRDVDRVGVPADEDRQ